jgi:hypothetical protein
MCSDRCFVAAELPSNEVALEEKKFAEYYTDFDLISDLKMILFGLLSVAFKTRRIQ